MVRSIPSYQQAIKKRNWDRNDNITFRLSGKTIGIIGLGRIGTAVAIRCKSFGMNIVFYDPYLDDGYDKALGITRADTLEDFLEQCDIISIHAPSTKETRGMVGSDFLRKVRDDCILINTARGGLVKEEDLVEAIEKGYISGAAFDVVTKEPIPDDHPFFKIIKKPNFILTPHVSWASMEAMQILSDQLIDNIENFVNGKPSNVVSGDF